MNSSSLQRSSTKEEIIYLSPNLIPHMTYDCFIEKINIGAITDGMDFMRLCSCVFMHECQNKYVVPYSINIDEKTRSRINSLTDEIDKLRCLSDRDWKVIQLNSIISQGLDNWDDIWTGHISHVYMQIVDYISNWEPISDLYIGIKNFAIDRITDAIAEIPSSTIKHPSFHTKPILAKSLKEHQECNISFLQSQIEYIKDTYDLRKTRIELERNSGWYDKLDRSLTVRYSS